MPPLPYSYRIREIYTIRLKVVYLDHFRPYYVKSGNQDQTALEIDSNEQIVSKYGYINICLFYQTQLS